MKLYINNNFKLCLSTYIFMLFDLYVVQFDTTQTPEYEAGLWNQILNRELDIDQFKIANNALKYSKAVSNLSTAISTTPYDLSYKSIKRITIDTNSIYKLNEPETTEHMIIILLKRFDKLNYISPLMASISKEYLLSANYFINLELFLEIGDNTKSYSNLLSKFKTSL